MRILENTEYPRQEVKLLNSTGSRPFTIAVAGKGGTGKTTIAGLVIQYLVQTGAGPVLAIDADPNANLNELLGFQVPQTIGQLEEEALDDPDQVPSGMTKKRWLELHLQQLLVEGEGRDLLVMGRGEGPRCYCAINHILREYIEVLSSNYEFLVMDNEAGMEHISRRTTSNIDLLLIVSTANPVSIKAARRINGLVDELDIRATHRYLVLNNLPDTLPPETERKVSESDLPVAARIPRDQDLLELCWSAAPLQELPDDSKALKKIAEMLGDLLPEKSGVD